MKKKIVLRGWMPKVKGKKVSTEYIPQIYHLRCDAVAMKMPGDAIVRVEIHEVLK